MHAHTFISRMNAECEALEDELQSIPPSVRKVILDLFALVEVQNMSIDVLLATNKKLLDTIDRLKR